MLVDASETHPVAQKEKTDNNLNYIFTIKTKFRVYIVATTSSIDMNAWIGSYRLPDLHTSYFFIVAYFLLCNSLSQTRFEVLLLFYDCHQEGTRMKISEVEEEEEEEKKKRKEMMTVVNVVG